MTEFTMPDDNSLVAGGDLPMPFVSYAQNSEDVMLWRAFKECGPGFYVDVGAAFPDQDSVTRAFYDRGWHGIDIEAVPDQAAVLARARPRDIALSMAAGAARGVIVLHVVENTGLSTTDAETARRLAELGHPSRETRVPVRPLREILALHAPVDIHFLKIDVEGAERAVLEGCDFEAHRPRVVLVEATKPLSTEPGHEAWEPLLLRAGYRFAFFDGLNRFYVADEWWHALGRHFETPVNVFDDYVRVSDADWARRAAQQERQAAAAAQRVRSAQASAEAAYERATGLALAAGADRARRELAEQQRDEAVRLRLAADTWSHACNARTQAAEAEMDALRSALVRSEQALDRSAQAFDRLAQQTGEVQAWLDALRGSASWRVTAPLRMIVGRLRGSPAASPPVAIVPARLERPAVASAPALPRAPVVPAEPPSLGDSPDRPAVRDNAPQVPAPPPATAYPRWAVHQFHAGSATGDAVTNSMLLIQTRLRALGLRSEIFVQHRDPALAAQLRTLDELPMHADHVLLVHHSMGYDALDTVLASPAPKILYYHNVTPVAFLPDIKEVRHYAGLGREQLGRLAGAVVSAVAPSEYNAIDLRRHGFRAVRVANLLFDVDGMKAAVAPAAPRLAEAPYTVLFVGRMIESKAQADLVDAFAAFRAALGRAARLVLVGRTDMPGRYLDTVVARVQTHGLAQSVVITGALSDAERDAQYAEADLYVSMSRHEGFGVPLVEAMCRGIPVLAWPCGAVPDVLDGAGLLDERRPDAVAARMLAIATVPAKRRAVIAAQEVALARHALARQWPALQSALVEAGMVLPADPETRRALTPLLHVAITGHAQGSYSLAAVNRGMAAAIEAERPGRARLVPVEMVPTTDLSRLPGEARLLAERDPPTVGLEVVVSQHYPVLVPSHRGTLTLAMVFWEESLLPEDTVATLDTFDGVLAPTRFVAKALIDSGVRGPVHVVGQAPDLSWLERVARDGRTGAADGRFVFLHVSSCFPRKGVDVLLAAFGAAFTDSDPVVLVIKGFPNPHNIVADQVAALRAGNPRAPAIEVIDAELDAAGMAALYRRADAMVLPTRGEGYNLPAAEAMAAGIPLIVTGLGGHMDFCDRSTARLVGYRLVPSESHLRSHGSLWAEPDEHDLVAAMREIEAARRDADASAAVAAQVNRARIAIRRAVHRPGFVRRLEDAALDTLLRLPPASTRIAWVSSWGVRCGVAEYTRHLLDAMPVAGAVGGAAGGAAGGAVGGHVVLADDRAASAAGGNAPVRVRAAWAAGDSASMDRLAGAIAAEDPGVVVVQHQAGLIGWAGLADLLGAPTMCGRVVVVTLHHTLDLPALDAALRDRVVSALQRTDRVFVHTIADMDRLHAFGLGEQAVLMPHGVSAGLAPRPPLDPGPAPLIGCYGFFLPNKGIPELIAALGLLRHSRPGARLRLVNAEFASPISAAEIDRCRRAAAEAGLSDAIEWETRFLAHADSLRLLSECHAIVLPTQSSMEASSAAVRTAMAAGVPVLVTPLPLFEDIGDAVARSVGTGPDAIAAGLERVLDPSIAAALQAKAQGWMEANAWPDVARRTLRLLLGLTSRCHRDRELP